MSINLTKRKYLLYLTLITLLLSGVGGVTYFSLVPEHYFGGYPLIPVFFYIFGVFNIYMSMLAGGLLPKRCCCFIWP